MMSINFKLVISSQGELVTNTIVHRSTWLETFGGEEKFISVSADEKFY